MVNDNTTEPWALTEDVIFGGQRYVIRWVVHGHYYAEAMAFWLEDPTERPEDIPADSLREFSAIVKWDECIDWRIGDDGYLHTCAPIYVVALCGAMTHVQNRGLEILAEREKMASLGLGKWD